MAKHGFDFGNSGYTIPITNSKGEVIGVGSHNSEKVVCLKGKEYPNKSALVVNSTCTSTNTPNSEMTTEAKQAVDLHRKMTAVNGLNSNTSNQNGSSTTNNTLIQESANLDPTTFSNQCCDPKGQWYKGIFCQPKLIIYDTMTEMLYSPAWLTAIEAIFGSVFPTFAGEVSIANEWDVNGLLPSGNQILRIPAELVGVPSIGYSITIQPTNLLTGNTSFSIYAGNNPGSSIKFALSNSEVVKICLLPKTTGSVTSFTPSPNVPGLPFGTFTVDDAQGTTALSNPISEPSMFNPTSDVYISAVNASVNVYTRQITGDDLEYIRARGGSLDAVKSLITGTIPGRN